MAAERTQRPSSRRRERLAWSTGAGVLLLVIAGSLMVLAMLPPANSSRGAVDAGAERDVLAGTPVFVAPTDHPAFFLVRTPTGIRALAAVPAHPHALPVVWVATEQHFVDPALGCTFQLDGTYVRGPCPRALDRYAATIRQGRVFVDVTQIIRGQAHA
jgi:nitrite reductase/ring-hydroxylating ferredoxin subunit